MDRFPSTLLLTQVPGSPGEALQIHLLSDQLGSQCCHSHLFTGFPSSPPDIVEILCIIPNWGLKIKEIVIFSRSHSVWQIQCLNPCFLTTQHKDIPWEIKKPTESYLLAVWLSANYLPALGFTLTICWRRMMILTLGVCDK